MDKLQKKIEQQINMFVENTVFPEFQKISKHSISRNYYNLYSPIYYKRKHRFTDNWVCRYNNGKYELYIDENVGFKHKGKWYYLPEVATKGNIKRRIGNEIKFIPMPFISKLRNELKANQIFINLLKKYGLTIK